MHEVRWPSGFKGMPPLLQAARSSGLGVLFPGKYQSSVFVLIPQWHSGGKRIFPRGPPHIDSQGFINPGSGLIERLMAKRSNHPEQLLLGPLARHFGNQTNDPWHNQFASDGKSIGSHASGATSRHSFSAYRLEPAGGFEHSICRLRFGRSGIELHRLSKFWRLYHRARALTPIVITP